MTRWRRVLVLVAAVALLTACASAPEHVINDQEAATANAKLGIDYMHKGELNKALTTLQQALHYNPKQVSANWALAIIYHRRHEEDKANTHFRRALQAQQRPEILNSYGAFLCDRGKTEGAVRAFSRAAGNPSYKTPADAWANAGLCLQRAGKTGQALHYYQLALEDNARHAPALWRMAQLQYAQNNYLQARGFLQRLQDVTTLSPEALVLGARIELALHNRPNARAYLQRYNAGHPTHPRSLEQLGTQADE